MKYTFFILAFDKFLRVACVIPSD